MVKIIRCVLVFFLLPFQVFSQNWSFEKNAVAARLKKDIYILASDSLEGRETGTRGETKAANYIESQFKEIGLSPFFTQDKYIGFFNQPAFKMYMMNISEFSAGEKVYERNLDFYPLYFSGSKKVSAEMVKVGFGIIAPELNYNDYKDKNDLKGKLFVIETGIPGGYSEKSPFCNYLSLKYRALLAEKFGAVGVIFVNSDRHLLNPSRKIPIADSCSAFPVIFFSGNPGELFNKNQYAKAIVKVELMEGQKVKGKLVAGIIDNHASQTIIIGAHFDHLGTSVKNGKKVIFYGADDNASGTAALMEMARYIKSRGLKNKNYIFVAFSGEEKGLIGSKYFASIPEIKNNHVFAMINFDMIGRLDVSDPKLTLEGTGSSPSWDTIIRHTKHRQFKVKKVAASTETSDQHPFYKKGIPVIMFFTGLHEDYHKPGDRASLVNYLGAAEILAYSEEIVMKLDQYKVLKYQKVPAIRSFFAMASMMFQML